MSSAAEVCNFALAHLGVSKQISNLETDRTQEAIVCRLFYEKLRDATLRDFNWPFATAFIELGLVEEDPNSEWAYSYQYPSDCLKIRRFVTGDRNETSATRVPYKIVNGTSGKLIYTDQEDAVIEYTLMITDPAQFTSDFVLALSLRIASYIAPKVTGGDPFKLGDRALNMYRFEISGAEASALNEEQPDQAPDSDLISSR